MDIEELKGTTIGERYFLQEILGQGGMGVVYKAHDQFSSQDVALKMLVPRPSGHVSQEAYRYFLERFRREAEVMKLSHPHIVPVYETGVDNGFAYLVMPYIAGRTLAHKLMDEGELPVRQALYYIEQIADAVTLAHNRGIIHRDLKPGNLLLDVHDKLFVADFGIAHLEGSTLTQTGEFLGTRGYAAPEVRLGEKIDQRADIYSLGCILFEMLVGDPPFRAGPQSHLPSGEIEAVINKARAEQPQDRYLTAFDFTQALRQARDALYNDSTDDSSVKESPPSPVSSSRVTPPPSGVIATPPLSHIPFSSRLFVVLLVSGAFVLAFLGAIFWTNLRPSSPPRIVAAPLVSPTSTKPSLPVEQAKQTVQQYYRDWNQKQYQAAYAFLDTAYQQSYSYTQLLPYYQHTHESCLTIDGSSVLLDGSIKIFVTDSAVEDDPNVPGKTVVHVYQGYYLVQRYVTGMKIMPYLTIQVGRVGVCPSTT